MAMINNFIEEQFPVGISYGSNGGPQFNTNIIVVGSGFEQRNINWSDARSVFSVIEGVKTEDQIRELVAFFRMVRGRAVGFRYKDWLDYSVTAESIGTGDTLEVNFQLTKNYIVGVGDDYLRTITKPVSGTVHVFEDGIENGGVTVDTTTGIITFPVAPAAGVAITATFEFDVPARFDSDEMNVTLDTATIASWSQIRIVEIRV